MENMQGISETGEVGGDGDLGIFVEVEAWCVLVEEETCFASHEFPLVSAN